MRNALGRKLNRDKSEKIVALRNVSLEITEGEHIGIIGKNGAGKSTLLRVLTKVIIPFEGKIAVDNSKHIVPLLELGIGFQPDLSGRENCFVAGMLIVIELIQNRAWPKFSLLCVGSAFVASLPFVAFKILYYNSLLPNPFYAKTGFNLAHLMSGLEYAGRFFKHYP